MRTTTNRLRTLEFRRRQITRHQQSCDFAALGPLSRYSLATAIARADAGTKIRLLGSLQAIAGNGAVQRMIDGIVFGGQAVHGSGSGAGFTVHGVADPHFDGGTSEIVDKKVTKPRTCKDCPEGECFQAKGTLVLKYHVDVDITMPDVPSGLNNCKTLKFRNFINTTLRKHENEHKRRFETYNGTKKIPFDVTGCGHDDIQSQLQKMHDDDAQERQDKAQALSDSIDPFTKTVDLSNCPN